MSPVKATVTLTSSNLPIFVIDTHGQTIIDESRIVADLGIIYNGEGQRNLMTDPFNNYNGRIAIELRGSSSMAYPKKQYRFETQNDLGEDSSVALVGLPQEADWILNGPYEDKTMLRNALAYGLSNDIGRYASRVRFCELILNNEYMGLYILLEKIKRDKNRVNISKLEAPDITGDDLTGGYIIKLDKTDGENVGGWNSSSSIYYQYHYPKPDEIVRQQKQYIQQFIAHFENVMAGSDRANPETGYPSIIDIDSFVDHFILIEFCRNIDGYRLSSYLYKDKNSKDGKMYAGPIWDYNLTFGKAWYVSDRNYYTGWEVDHNKRLPYDAPKIPYWWENLARDHGFAQRAAEHWAVLRDGVLDIDSLNNRIDRMAELIADARVRNSVRWPEMGDAVAYANEIIYLKSWIRNRVSWIDANIASLSPIQADPSGHLPLDFSLGQNYPNPFNASTWIPFAVPEPVRVKLEVINLYGERVAVLIDATMSTGNHRICLKTDRFAAGIYFLYFQAGDFKAVKKMTVLK
ncbi:MAG: CotH kinase family protein [Candidatus Neomarinimicrobiota bacterium]